jgi:hypothetical protein
MRLYVLIELLLLLSYFVRLILFKINYQSFFDSTFVDVSYFFFDLPCE